MKRGRWAACLLVVALGIVDAPRLVDSFIGSVIGAPRKEGIDEILYPGQRSQQLRRERRARGTVDVPEHHIVALVSLAAELNVPVPSALLRPQLLKT